MERKKRILFIYTKMVGGGAERVLIDFLRNIDYDTYEVDLALVEKGGVLLDQVPSKVNIIALWKKNSLHYFMAVKFSLYLHSNFMFSRRLNSNILRIDYDIEIAFLEGLPSKLLALRKTNSKKYSWIHVDIHTFHISKSVFSGHAEEFRVYAKADKIITVSKDCRKGFVKCFPQLDCKTEVIYNPIDIKEIVKKADSPDNDISEFFDAGRLNIITVARLHHQKNPKRLLQVANLAKSIRLPVKFLWLGEGEMMAQMQRERTELGLEDYVEFIGFQKNPYPFIKRADILLLTSDAEGFGLVLCEAMALKTPVISTPTAGPKEIIGENKYGIISGFSPESIVDAIKTLISNPDMRNAMIERGFKRAEDFSVEKAIESLYSLL